MRLSLYLTAAATLALTACDGGSSAGGGGGIRPLRIVGSSTVYPFTTAVAEQYARANPAYGAPTVESTGTGGGVKLFCAGVGMQHPDIVNASRRLKASEYEDCAKNGVKDIVELQIGIDGLAFVEANSAEAFKLTVPQLYQALAKTPYGKPQTAKLWSDIDPSLPKIAIQVYGPPPTSGTRDALAELILAKGCDANPEMKALKASDEDRHKEICTTVREDGPFIEAGENDNLMIQKVAGNPGSLGILGYSFLEKNTDRVRGVALNGIDPTYATISSFEYPGARPLYIYVKSAHLNAIPGLKEFVAEYARGWKPDGYLTRRGLIAAPEDVRAANEKTAVSLTPLDKAALK